MSACTLAHARVSKHLSATPPGRGVLMSALLEAWHDPAPTLGSAERNPHRALRCTQSTVGRACSCLPACKGVTRRVQRLSGGSNISFQVPSLHCTDPYVCLTSFLAEGSFARSRVSRRGGGTERACSSTPADCNARGRREPWSRPRPRRHPCERPAGAYEHLRHLESTLASTSQVRMLASLLRI